MNAAQIVAAQSEVLNATFMLLLGVGIGIPFGGIAALMLARWLRRPKRTTP